ncbi:MAG: tetratricopeptide repeat protein [Pseudomonadota bacterium]
MSFRFTSQFVLAAVLAPLLFGWSSPADGQIVADCGRLENAYGPFDYTNGKHRKDNLPIVERFHFTARVENLAAGESGTIIGDLDYTLRAFPNHHRALYAMMRWQIKNPEPPATQYFPLTCYFDRAIAFKPTDAVPHLLYGMYLQTKGELEPALEKYKASLALDSESAEANYNIGLLYFQLKDYSHALEHAHTAYANGHQLPGLRNKLKRSGHWQNDPA